MIGGGGAARSAEQVADFDSAFANTIPSTGWGITETNSLGTTISGPDYFRRPNSCVRPGMAQVRGA